MKIKNGKLFDQKFSESFIALSKLKGLDAKAKFNLVKLRKEFTGMIGILQESMKDLDREQAKRLLEEENEYTFVQISPSKVIDQLSADDLFNLEPLLTKEDL